MMQIMLGKKQLKKWIILNNMFKDFHEMWWSFQYSQPYKVTNFIIQYSCISFKKSVS